LKSWTSVCDLTQNQRAPLCSALLDIYTNLGADLPPTRAVGKNPTHFRGAGSNCAENAFNLLGQALRAADRCEIATY